MDKSMLNDDSLTKARGLELNDPPQLSQDVIPAGTKIKVLRTITLTEEYEGTVVYDNNEMCLDNATVSGNMMDPRLSTGLFVRLHFNQQYGDEYHQDTITEIVETTQ
jgi:hypothetical protein